ncbi:MAG: YqgE/AlgH family protein [Rhizobacter sp.]|nr:YqgE/AlgH family protein [Chlorobiales bacterium]
MMTLEAGAMLVAGTELNDSNFKRSVILLCEHGEPGSFGLVLNRPLELKLADVTQGADIFFDAPVFLGGPVQPNTLHVLHTKPLDNLGESSEVVPGVYWGSDFEKVRDALNQKKVSPSEFRFFLGYAGWGAGQLAGEVAEAAWILAQGLKEFVFDFPPEKLWSAVLRRMGGDYAILANTPEDLRLN